MSLTTARNLSDLPTAYAGYCNSNWYISAGTICESSASAWEISDILYNNSRECPYDDPGCTYTWKYWDTSYNNYGYFSHKWAVKDYINWGYIHWYSYSYIRWFPRELWGYTFSIYSAFLNQWLDFVANDSAGFLYTMSDWSTAIFDKVYFRHDTIVFMDSSNGRTLQLIWHNALEDYVLYSDPTETNQNLWLLNFKLGQAWSMSVPSNQILSQYMMGKENLTVEKIVNFGWSMKYQIVDGWSLFWPSTHGNQAKDDSYIWDTYTYTYDFVFTPPLAEGWSDPEINNPWSSFGNWTNCQNKWLIIRNLANLQNKCYNSYLDWVLTESDYLTLLDYVLWYWNNNILTDTWSSFTTTGTACNNYLLSARTLYNDDISEEDYLWSVDQADSNSYDQNLIDPANYCWSSVSVITPWDSPSGIVSTLKELLGVWSNGSWSYITEIRNEFTTNISEAFSWKFNTDFIQVYKNAYDSWYNYLATEGFSPSCEATPYIETQRGNYLLYFVSFWLIFLLLTLFI